MSDFPKSLVHVYTSGNSTSSFPFNKLRKRNEFWPTVRYEIFVGVYLCGLAIFCVLWELIFTIRIPVLLAGNKVLQFYKFVQIVDNILFVCVCTSNGNTVVTRTVKGNGKQFELSGSIDKFNLSKIGGYWFLSTAVYGAVQIYWFHQKR